MKKLTVTLVLLMSLALISSGQSKRSNSDSKFTLGIFGGLNIPRLNGGNGNELSRDYTSRSGEAFGLTSSLGLGSKFSLCVNLMYSSEGGKRNGVQAIDASSISPLMPVGTYFYAAFNNESILNYLEIPVMVRYSILLSKSQKVYANFGTYFGYLLKATQKTSGSSLIYADREETMIVIPAPVPFNASTDITSSINKINLGLTGGVGFLQKAGPGDLFLDVRAAYGMIVIQKDPNNGSSHSGNLLLDLGYAFHF
jgi:hypothetical protein